ncbi:MAG TPA: hypothetical protein VIS06_19325 [Mycobacteriales bacterium]
MSSRHPVTRVAGWAAAGVLAAAATGVGIAYAADPSPSPTATSSPTVRFGASDSPGEPGDSQVRGGHGRKARPLAGGLPGRRVMHGEMVVSGRNGAPTTVDVQRGKVTDVSASSITVRSDDGFTATYRITSDTVVRINQKGATTAKVSDGDTAVVLAHRSGDTSTAQRVLVRS